MFVLVFVFIFSGCSLISGDGGFRSEDSTQIAEAFLPQGVTFLWKFQTNDEEELQNFKILQGVLLDDEKDAQTQDNLTPNIDPYLSEWNLSYEKDFKPILGEQTEIVVACGENFLLGEQKESWESLDLYFVMKLADTEKYNALVQKLLDQKEVFAIEGGYKISLEEEVDLYFTEKDSYLIATGSLENFVHLLTLKVEDSLVYNEKYVEVRENLPNPFSGLLYINLEQLMMRLKNSVWQEGTQIDQADLAIFENSYAKILNVFGLTLSFQSDGMQFLSYLGGNEKNMQELKLKFDLIPNQSAVLDKKLPGEGLYFYAEDFDLKTRLAQLQQNLQEQDQKSYQDSQEFKRQLKIMFGLDLDKDLLSWMDRAYAFSMQKNTKLIPSMTLAFDANSNPEGAGKLLDTIDSFVSILLLNAPEYAEAINKEEVTVGKSLFQKITVLPEKLPAEVQAEGDLIMKVLADLEILYGVTDENLLVITTYSDFAEEFNVKTISQNRSFKQISEKVATKNQGAFYFSPAIMTEYLEKLVEFSQAYSPMSEQDQMNFKKGMKALKHFESLIFVGIAHQYTHEGQAYVKIN